MGNLKYPHHTSTIERALAYKKRIMAALPPGSDFMPCMTLYLTDQIDPDEVVRGYRKGAWQAVKLYMANQLGQGGTTGSAHGVKSLLGRYPVFAAMEEHGIPLLGHFEAVEDNIDEFDREIRSVERDLIPLLYEFPQLRVVFEHITDGRAAQFVADDGHTELYATVTAHHMMLNRNSMFSGGLSADKYCKPVPKREVHRQKVRKYVTSGLGRFGAGTDSAPHDQSAKSRCHGCAAGIFTAYSAVELYTKIFEEDGALENLGAFLSTNFLHVYGVEPSNEMMTIRRQPNAIPATLDGIPVFMGGDVLSWKVVR
jgi:dihydroorotase